MLKSIVRSLRKGYAASHRYAYDEAGRLVCECGYVLPDDLRSDWGV